ncbi:hypothetical protein [Hymenobacter jeollabukensis]|uniref:Uncharacterized protein n=1 Tax=Hymenobacter jeollabukensis TaxID=2025313 RepID=A0A5R8WIJ0_9BACT|nr:hypothetical protein [Hymenobacter jeollabukensis]TLM88688.1 hypothetical protein FDY95_22905 [Hymenobacter jeollabukensis]
MSAPKSPSRTSLPQLNERQQLYLVAAYRLDQELEQEHKHDYVRGRAPVPAAEWRLIPYGRWKHRLGAPATELRQRIEQHEAPGTRLVDPGAGSTWKALAERGLVEIEERVVVDDPHPRIGYSLPYIRLTRKGRRLVRQLTGEQRPPAPRRAKPQQPEGLLPQQVWRALVLAYQQDAEGVALDTVDRFHACYARIPANSFEWLEQLGLVDAGPRTAGPAGQWPVSYHVTESGRDYYQRYYRVNTTAYRNVPAELPRPVLSAEHRTFWQRVQVLSLQRDGAGLDQARAEACRRELLQLQLAEPGGALYAAPFWYPMLAGRAVTTRHNRSAEDFGCATEAEALTQLQQLKQRWQQQLAALP